MSGTIGDNVFRASGVIAAAAAAGGVSWQAVETGATFTAVAGIGYPVNTIPLYSSGFQSQQVFHL